MNKYIKIEPFSEEHIKKTLDILYEYHKFHASNFPDYFKDMDKEEEKEYLSLMLKEENNYGYVASINNEIVGFALFGLVSKPANFVSPEVAYIYEIVVKEQHRHKGVGNALVKKIIEFSQTMGIDKIELEIKNSNEQGISFYQKAGFYDYSKTMFLDI